MTTPHTHTCALEACDLCADAHPVLTPGAKSSRRNLALADVTARHAFVLFDPVTLECVDASDAALLTHVY